MQNFNLPPYHAKAEDIVNHFHPNSQKDRNKILSKPPGYLPAEFIKVREVHGFNILEGKPKPSLLEKIWDNLMDNQMLLLLLGSAVISAALGQWDDSISILVAIIIVFTVGFIQELRSDESIQKLTKLEDPMSKVYRNGQLEPVAVKFLLPGEIIKVFTGDRIPADVRWIETQDLLVDESNLTGESEPVQKIWEPIQEYDLALSARRNLGYMGSMVHSGYGIGIVIGIGKETELGKIVTSLDEIEEAKSPLQESMNDLSQQLTKVSLILIVFLVLWGVLMGSNWLELVTIGVSLAVAAIPEGLPIVVTVTLALGVLRMSKDHILVKNLPSVETLGSINVLCLDKTGTITENLISVHEVYISGEPIHSPRSSQPSSPRLSSNIKLLATIANLCNDANFTDQRWVGQSTDIGLLQWSLTVLNKDLRNDLTKTTINPFSSSTKWMSIQYQNHPHYFKGSLEATLAKCKKYISNHNQVSITSSFEQSIWNVHNRWASQGFRVLALAKGDQLDQLVFCGLVALSDPPRPEVESTLFDLQRSGIKPVIITGDSPITAHSIARQIGLPVHDVTQDCIVGTDLERMSDRELGEALDRVWIFARTTPQHKLRIVSAFQARGDVVAMTGDGVNDTPALRLSDLGVAMGGPGASDIARESAQLILVKDNLRGLVSGVAEGRGIFNNIQNFLTFQLSTSLATLMLVALTTLFKLGNPLNAMQILYVNILMDGPPAQSLGVESYDPAIVTQPPRQRNTSLLTPALLTRVIVNGVLMGFGTFLVYLKTRDPEVSISSRATTMTFTALVVFDMVNALTCRSPSKILGYHSLPHNWSFYASVGASLLGHVLVLYVPFLQKVFQTEAISARDWLFLIIMSSLIIIVDGIIKYRWYGLSTHSNTIYKPVATHDDQGELNELRIVVESKV